LLKRDGKQYFYLLGQRIIPPLLKTPDQRRCIVKKPIELPMPDRHTEKGNVNVKTFPLRADEGSRLRRAVFWSETEKFLQSGLDREPGRKGDRGEGGHSRREEKE